MNTKLASPLSLPIPPELKGLELYEQDQRLLKAWPKLVVAMAKAYPGVNIPVEVAKAHAWEVANPQRRKVRRARFLTNWLGRAQDKGGVGDDKAYVAPWDRPSPRYDLSSEIPNVPK